MSVTASVLCLVLVGGRVSKYVGYVFYVRRNCYPATNSTDVGGVVVIMASGRFVGGAFRNAVPHSLPVTSFES